MRAATSGITIGLRRALPILPVVFLVSAALGVLARTQGMPWAAAVVMSATTFAGAAQFASIAVLPSDGAAAAILAGALLNVRYVAMGLFAATSLRGPRAGLNAQLIVDESWALAHVRPGVFDGRVLIGAGLGLYAVWTTGTAAGHILGSALGDPRAWGADAAVPAVFLGLLFGQLRAAPQRLAAAAGGVIALAFTPLFGMGLAIAAASVGAAVPRR